MKPPQDEEDINFDGLIEIETSGLFRVIIEITNDEITRGDEIGSTTVDGVEVNTPLNKGTPTVTKVHSQNKNLIVAIDEVLKTKTPTIFKKKIKNNDKAINVLNAMIELFNTNITSVSNDVVITSD